MSSNLGAFIHGMGAFTVINKPTIAHQPFPVGDQGFWDIKVFVVLF